MFGKIFESTFTGSMVGSGSTVFAVWSYVIANTRPPGVVEINPKLLGMILGCSESDVEAALEVLCGPDPKSRSKDHQGRRLLRTGEFLYSVPTWEKYRALRNDDERKAYNADAQRRSRAKRGVKRDVNDCQAPSATVSHGQPPSAQAEAEASVQKREKKSPAAPVFRPDDVPQDLWDAYMEVRKAKRAPMTSFAMKGLMREAKACGLTLEAAITVCAERNWLTVKPGWLEANPIKKAGKSFFAKKESAHVPNMPLGAPSCPCDECVGFRSKKEAK